jgi:hypothetical protein
MKQELHLDPEAVATATRLKHEKLIHRLLSDPAKVEAQDWLKSEKTGKSRTVGSCETNRDSLEFVQEIYNLGAPEIFAVNIHAKPNSAGERTGKLVVTLPEDPKQRSAIFDWCKHQGESLGFTPDADHGESHLFLLLD